MKREILYSLPLCAVLSITACGGGGDGDGSSSTSYSGSQVQATITADNAEQLARSATEGATEATAGDGLSSLPLAIQTTTSYEMAEKMIVGSLPQALEYLANSSSPSAYQEEMPCSVSGSILVNADDSIANNTDQTSTPESGTMTMDFRDCREDNTSTINGKATINFTGGGGFSAVYQNFTIAYTHPITGEQVVDTIENMTVVCDANYGCSIQSDFVGADGRTYRIEDMTVSGSDTSGWNVSATVYDPDLGSVNFETTAPLMLDCPTGVPSSGALSMRGSNLVVATVTYTSCTEFQVCLEGVCNTATW